MILAELKNGVVNIKEFKNIPELGMYAIGDHLNEELLNSKGYYCLGEDPVFDPIMQYLGAYEIAGNKAVRKIENKIFATIEEEKANKIKELNDFYQDKISKAIFPWQEKAAFGEIIPEEIKQIRIDLVSECHSKELVIKALTELREVINYGW